MELAYALAEDQWGNGIVAEASQVLMSFCFKEFDLKRIQAHYKKENIQSGRVMQKIGMNYEGTLKAAKFHRERF
ncbi:MAG: GNAT family N-acetyltransferase, partial [Moraxellaceae bacterium]|nr:GNAT family N-acetyltransferase [Pseudobdellovibrionaceae bacterium]